MRHVAGSLRFVLPWALLVVVPRLASAEAPLAPSPAFRPFSDVKDVCPTCDPERFDRIALKSGGTVKAWVVAENPIFYVLERFGELRAAMRDQVSDVTLSKQRSRGERHTISESYKDQILLDDGMVFAGTITEERAESGMYRLRSAIGNVDHLLYRARILRLFKGETEVPMKR